MTPVPHEFDDDVIDTLHHRWTARSARFQAMVTRTVAATVESGTVSDVALPDGAQAS